MRIIKSLEEVDFLDVIVGSRIIQAIVDPFELRFRLDNGDEINIESKITFTNDGRQELLDIQDQGKKLVDLYSVIDKPIIRSAATSPLSWQIEFENGASIELCADNDGYESIQGLIKAPGSFAFVIS